MLPFNFFLMNALWSYNRSSVTSSYIYTSKWYAIFSNRENLHCALYVFVHKDPTVPTMSKHFGTVAQTNLLIRGKTLSRARLKVGGHLPELIRPGANCILLKGLLLINHLSPFGITMFKSKHKTCSLSPGNLKNKMQIHVHFQWVTIKLWRK